MPKVQRGEKLEFKVTRTTKHAWNFYKKYHYLTESIGTGHYYEMTLNNKKVGFLVIARFPHPQAKDIMTISRIVIVPEFQGFGIGIKFMNLISDLYKSDRIRITTSLKPFMIALNRSKEWICVRSGRTVCDNATALKSMKNASSKNRITATFQYKRQ